MVAEPAEEKELTMEDVIASTKAVGFVNYKPGKRIKGTVIRADETGIYVRIGGKKDGFIDKADAVAEGEYNPADFKTGDAVEATIVASNKEYVSLSKKEVDILRAEDEQAEAALSSGEFSLKMTEVVKGGLRGRMGRYTVFVPASQIRIGYVKNLEDYKDKVLRLTLMPPKEREGAEGDEAASGKRSRYLFASQRIILEREKKEKRTISGTTSMSTTSSKARSRGSRSSARSSMCAVSIAWLTSLSSAGTRFPTPPPFSR